jgi:two-component system, NarL family, invasion response regulator UvrY
MTSVLVIDDQPIVLKGCRHVLQDAGVQIVFEARDLVSGYRLYCRRHPDVVVIDLRMRAQNLGGLSLIRRMHVRDSRTQILVFSMDDSPAVMTSALAAGASGYLLKDSPYEELARAIEQVCAGKPYLSHQVAVQVALWRINPQPDPLAGLTQREIQTLTLLSQGRSYALIAAELGVRHKTVVDMSSQLRLKLGVRSLPELILKAIELLSTASDVAKTRSGCNSIFSTTSAFCVGSHACPHSDDPTFRGIRCERAARRSLRGAVV